MQDFDLKAELNKKKALVVHFSHHAKMRNGGVFPQDMLDAIENKNDWMLSCSVVWPNHNMDLVGSVGIIFDPSDVNVFSVSSSDSGSSTSIVDGTEITGGDPLNAETFLKTFQVDGAYNEWRVKGAEVSGIFIANPLSIYVKTPVTLKAGDEVINDISAESISLKEVFDIFPNLQVYTIKNGDIVQLNKPC